MLLGGMFETQHALYCETDMFLTGHDHNVELIDKGQDSQCPNTYFAISGAGAKVRSSTQPKIGKQLYYNHSTPALAYLELSGGTLLFQFIDQNGQLMFEKTISK